MNDIHVGIIGGTGGMGRIFADLFRQEGYMVHVSGRTRGPDMPAMAEICQVVVVSVPIGVTVEIIKQIGPHMKQDALLMDLTSLKAEPIKAMLQSSSCEVIGLHPLFGPDVDNIAGCTVVLCPARTERWLDWTKGILTKHGAIVVETTPDRHDELMALVQVLNHVNSITMGMVLSEWGVDLAELQRFATPMFTAKLDIIKEIFTNNPRLYAEIIALNPHTNQIIEFYRRIVSDIETLSKQGDAQALTALMEERSLWQG
jgi:prephenate dehydrogenase